jgi:hypothetical protein
VLIVTVAVALVANTAALRVVWNKRMKKNVEQGARVAITGAELFYGRRFATVTNVVS